MAMSPRLLRPRATGFNPRLIPGLALWLDASDTSSLYTTDAGAVTAVSAPTDIAGCALWLDASDSSTITHTGGAVSEWRDKTTNGRHYTASTTARPSTGTRTQNGLNVIDFDGVNHQMSGNAASLSLFRNVSSGHVFVVAKMDTTAANPFIFSSSTASASHLNRAQVFVDGSGNLSIGGRRLDADGFQYVTVPSVPTVPTVLSAHFDWASSDLFFRRDGVVVSSLTTFQTDGATSDTNSLASALGGAGAGFRMDGYIAEIIVFNAAITSAQRASVEAYLAARWGISGVHRPVSQELTAVSSPLELSGCAGWWDASRTDKMWDATSGGSLVANGGLVRRLDDLSGNGKHLVQATSPYAPSRQDGGLNGLSVLDLQGTKSVIAGEAGDWNFLHNTQGGTVFLVMKPSTVSDPQSFAYIAHTSLGGATNTVGINLFYDDRVAGYGRNNYFSAAVVLGVSGQQAAVTELNNFFSAANSYSILSVTTACGAATADRAFAYTNGLRQGTANTATNAPSSSNSAQAFRIGSEGGNSISGLAEAIVFNTVLSTTDRARVEKYLAAKWGISNVPDPTPPVGAWLDKSGNARHATQSTAANRPTISATKQGGRTAVAFASSTRTVASPATVAQYVADATTSPKMFFAWVARPEGGVAGITFGTAPTNPNSSSRVFFASDYGGFGSHIVDFGSIGGARLTGTVGDEENNAGHVYSAYRDGSVVSVRRDGVEILRKTNASGSYTATNGTLSLNTAEAGSSTASWMEFMAYAASLPAASIARLERYLAAKWGIALAPQVSNADAQNWIDRVYANGGTVSASTAAAVNTLCIDLENASLRDRFYRLNLFCGTGLNAALVPLYRGPALGGTQYGNTTDTNVGPFVSGDYAETNGLDGDGVTKYLNTGLSPDGMGVPATVHLAAFKGAGAWTTSREFIGTRDADDLYQLQMRYPASLVPSLSVLVGGSASIISEAAVSTGASFLIATRSSSSELFLWQNGTKIATGTTNATTPGACANPYMVFTRNASGTAASGQWEHAMRAYSIGLGLNDSQAVAYNTAMQTFQTALGRNV